MTNEMIAHCLRLLTLVAVILMPAGMVAPAEAHGAMGMSIAHCPDQAPAHHPKPIFAECTMACAAALPAVDRISGDAPPSEPLAVLSAPSLPLAGLHPETATPPPRQA